jgi:hypothetical protein
MAIDPYKKWQPGEWETHVNDLLRARHGHENYVEIPDSHGGDSGLEGYSLDGIAYQAYAPDELCKPADLYEKQRDKMTADINKFIKNAPALQSLLGRTQIRRWVLVVPKHVSQNLVAHASTKTSEVLAAQLSYVDDEQFAVLVQDRDAFKVEEQKLLEQGIHKLKIELDEVTDQQVKSFESDEQELTENISKKLLKLPNADSENVLEAKALLVKRFIVSENIIQRLQEEYPQYYAQIQTLKSERENDLKIEALGDDRLSLGGQEIRFLSKLEGGSKLHSESNLAVAQGTIADWLMRCPLDFK